MFVQKPLTVNKLDYENLPNGVEAKEGKRLILYLFCKNILATLLSSSLPELLLTVVEI